jgi:acetoin utilization deacetylase AcuC-like enzyme
MSSTLFIQHSQFDQHSVPPSHPESPLRSLAVETRLRQTGLWQDLNIQACQPVSSHHFKDIHNPGYIDQLYRIAPAKGMILADADTPLTFNTLTAVEEAAGSGIQAVKQVLSGEFKNAFCAVRPPGHHAEPGKTIGFCFINNIALAAEYALTRPDVKKVLIFDFDVHQANGTIEIFKDREDVMVISIFQHPFFPFSHWTNKHHNVLNIPIKAQTASTMFRRLTEKKVMEAVSKYKPDMMFLSAGFDAHTDDPMGGLDLIDDDYYWLTKMSMSLANTYCKGRLVSMMEGGYNLEALALSSHQHIQALSDN